MATGQTQLADGFSGLRFIGVTLRPARTAGGNAGTDYQAAFEVTLPSGVAVRRVLSIPDFELDRAQRAAGRSIIEIDGTTGLPEVDAGCVTSLFLRKFNANNVSLGELSVGLEDLEGVLRST
jgi:hypothetical protein